MNDADRATIVRELPNLLQAVQLSPELLSQLLRLRVLTLAEEEELKVVPEPRERLRQLLLAVTRRGPAAFDGLVRALLETGQLAAARLLRPGLSLADLVPAVGGGVCPTTPAHRPPPQPQPQPEQPRRQGDQQDQQDQRRPRPQLRVRPAERRLGSPSDSYRMEARPRGLALVVSNVNFRDEELHGRRDGGQLDEVALSALLRELGFSVLLERDLDRAQLRAAVAGFAKRDEHAAADMAVLAVLTHGGEHVLYGVDSRQLPVEEVIAAFSHEAAPLLAEKPKWLIFQACRGVEKNRVVRVLDPARQGTDGCALSAPERRLPEVGDIYITYSTIPGRVSMRDLDEGTWLVQMLCRVFAEHAHHCSLSELHRLVHNQMEQVVTADWLKQTIETAQRGWRKNLFFNPGL